MEHIIRIAFLVLLQIATVVCQAQLLYPVAGTYKGKSAQGMAIWEDDAYLFNDGGGCRVFDLNAKKVTREFLLASAGKNNHANAVCFANRIIDGKKTPTIYVSECRYPNRCFVECINDSSSTLVQTIEANEKDKNLSIQSWIIDDEAGYLYGVTRLPPSANAKNSDLVKIYKYRLPLLDESKSIILTENDCIDFFIVEFTSILQGGKIKGKYMYLVSGLQETLKDKYVSKRALQIIDLKKRKLVKTIDLTYVTTNEPEDMDFYKGKALLYAGQEGGIYNVKLK